MTPPLVRLLALAATTWTVALLCILVPDVTWACAGVLGVGAILAVLVVLCARGSERRRASTAALLVVLCAAGAAVALSVLFALPARESARTWDGRVVEAVAEISSSASIGRDGRLWVEATASRIGTPGDPRPVTIPVRIGVEPTDGFDLGASVRVTAEAVTTDVGERSALVLFASEAEVLSPASGVFGLAAEVKRAFAERSLRLPAPGAGLLPGLAVGDTRAVPAELNDDMRTSGLSHLTAVSGANCAIVVGALFWLTAVCRGGRALRVVLSLLALGVFVVLVTPEPSVIRAAVMAAVGMLTVLLGRPTAGAAMLALCVTVVLLADPWLASSPGFALSVAASGALILLAPRLARGLERVMPRLIALAVAVPLAAQLACGPIIALFADQQSLIGIVANLVAGPAAPIATVVGLLGCLTAPVPWLADLFVACAWLPAAWIATTAHTAAALPFAQVLLPAGLGSAALVALVSVCLALFVAGPTSVTGAAAGPDAGSGAASSRLLALALQWVRPGAATVLIVVVSLAGARFVLDGPLVTATAPGEWSIAACDVGQGDALLVRSQDHVALIDTGPAPEPLSDCLRSLGIDRIDLLVLTHYDLDHVGGVEAVRGRVGDVLHGPVAEEDEQRILDGLAAAGARLSQASAGLTGRLGGATWRVLWPGAQARAFPSGNDASVVLDVEGGGVPRSLFLGDLSAEPQRALQRAIRLSPYDVVKVAHHGSVDQDPGLYQIVRARIALFSVGTGNDYGHPRVETLDLVESTGARVLRTDLQGRLLLGLRDRELRVWTQREPG